jgi:hypothetical protein
MLVEPQPDTQPLGTGASLRRIGHDRPALPGHPGRHFHGASSTAVACEPWHVNIAKRLVKRPKLYVRDSGLLHLLLTIRSLRDLAGHNKLNAPWEGFALEAAARAVGTRHEELAFWATHSGAEVDL